MNLAGAVIGGGQSKRMGVNKGWLKHQGRTLATRLLAEMDKQRLEPLILNAADAPADLPGWVSLVPDDHPDQGPMEGLASVLRLLDRPVLVCAVDMPNVDAAAMEALLKAYAQVGGSGLVAKGSDGWHPLFGIYAPGILPQVESALAKGQRALHVLIEEAKLPSWTPEPRWLVNLNSPEDRAAWEAEHGRLQGP
jgi:molybdopterin-guanine dinucleotide biosynthesis protein A